MRLGDMLSLYSLGRNSSRLRMFSYPSVFNVLSEVGNLELHVVYIANRDNIKYAVSCVWLPWQQGIIGNGKLEME